MIVKQVCMQATAFISYSTMKDHKMNESLLDNTQEF